MNPRKEVQRFVFGNYGNLILASDPKYEESTQIWESELQSNYPRVIHDDKYSDRPVVRFVALRNLGYIRFDDNTKVISATPRDECTRALEAQLTILRQRAERIMVRASAYQLAQPEGVRHVLSPIVIIINNLLNPYRERPILRHDQIRGEDNAEKLIQYLKLLEELEIVRQVQDGYTYGNTFSIILDVNRGDHEKLKLAILSHVIREKYAVLREAFDITQIVPYINLDNCYYWHAIEAGKVLYTRRSTLRDRHIDYYGLVSELSFNSRLTELLDVGALKQEGSYCYANEELFQNMLQMKGDLLNNITIPSA